MMGSLSLFSAGAAGALFSAIWEGALLALGVFLCLRFLPGLSAAARSVVWLNVFVLLVLLHFVPAFAPRTGAAPAGHLAAVHLDARWSLAIVSAWVVLSLWRAVQLVMGMIHLRKMAARAVPVGVDAEVEALLADTPGRPARLCLSNVVRRPSVLGFFHPRILVPPGLADALTAQELQQVVLHEMEHLRRGDDWTNLVQKVGLVLFPLNPVLLWVERRLCAERELACDDRVIRSIAGRKAYALCLARLAEFSLLRRSFSLMLGLWERRPELVRRVQRIVSQPVRSMGRRTAIIATGSVLAGALGCAVALAHSPELISFVPVRPAVLVASPLDPHEVVRALGGVAQLTRATLPVRAPQMAPSTGRQKAISQTIRRAVRKTADHRRRVIATQLAGVTPVPAPLQTLERRQLIVLTEVTTFQAAPPRAVLAISDGHAAHPGAIRAAYAIVPTPNGWLIIKI